MDFQQQGIQFAIENIKRGKSAGWANGTAFDDIRHHAGPERFEAEKAFLAGIALVRELPQSVTQAIQEANFASIDWVWSQGQVLAWVFPYIKEMGVLTMTCADDQGNDLPFVKRVERGS